MKKSVIRHKMQYALDAVGPYWTNWGRYEGDAIEIDGILYPEGEGELVLKPVNPSIPRLTLKGTWHEGEFVKGEAVSANPRITQFSSINGRWKNGEWQGGRVTLENNDFFEGEWIDDSFNMTKMRYTTPESTTFDLTILKMSENDAVKLAEGKVLTPRKQVKANGLFAVKMDDFEPEDIANQFKTNTISFEQLTKTKNKERVFAQIER